MSDSSSTRSPRIALPDFLGVAARSHPEKRALSFRGQHLTFSELQRAVCVADQLLRACAALSSGERIGILSGNRPGVAIAAHAAARIGSTYVPLNWRQTPDELAWQIRDARVSLLLVDEDRIGAAKRAASGLPVPIMDIGMLEEEPAANCAIEPAPSIELDREAIIIYTSGTSGRPKGARISYGNLWFSAIASALNLGHHADDVWLAALPMFHIGGLSIIYRGLIGCTTVVLHDRFDPVDVLATIDDGATLVSLTPIMLRRMIEHRTEAAWPSTLRAVLLGGASTPLDLVRTSLNLGIPIAPTYGLTETASQTTTLGPREVSRKTGSSGLPLPLTEIRITERGKKLPAVECGEIEVRGPTVFNGYIGESGGGPDDNGWFATGDAGYLDEEGYLYVVDRRGDLINSGGENIYPAEIERVLLEHPAIADAGVVGVPSARWGARPVAAIVWTGEPESAERDIQEFCRARIAGYKVPDRIVLVGELPRSASGKLLRRRLLFRIEGTDVDCRGSPSG